MFKLTFDEAWSICVKYGIEDSGSVMQIAEAIRAEVLIEREECGLIADEFETFDYECASRIARQIRARGNP